ncbi:MAG: glycosyltransferase family 2 protein [Candidatus Dormibacteria bacterium]
MFWGRKVAVVVPAFNERDHILRVLGRSPALVDFIIVVDDKSTDGTAELVLAHRDPRVRLVQQRTNQGLGAALTSGHRLALELGCDISVVMAGDDQMDPDYLPNLLAPLAEGRADVAKGNRFFSWTSMRQMPAPRLLGGLVLTWFTRVASGYWHLKDAQNGYIAFTAAALQRIDFAKVASGYAVENAMLIQLGATGARLVDVPIPARYGSERSKMHIFQDGAIILGTVVKAIPARYLRRSRRQ